MKFTSTHNSALSIGASEAILMESAVGGGMLVPSSFPYLSEAALRDMRSLSFEERVAKVLSLYIDDISYETLLGITSSAYSRFDFEPCPVVKIEDGLYLAELWHGNSFSVYDIANAIYPDLIEACKRARGVEASTVIIADEDALRVRSLMCTFKGKDAHVLAFYPLDGVDSLRRKLVGSMGFANAYGAELGREQLRSTVRKALEGRKTDALLLRDYSGSPARILPLVACYISAYCDLIDSEELEEGEEFNVAVPVSDMSLALAGYFARRMGLPIKTIVLGVNSNVALRQLYDEGTLDLDRSLYRTSSPLMDVLVPENLEGYLYYLLDGDSKQLIKLLGDLAVNKKFELKKDFDPVCVGWADEDDVRDTVFNFFDLSDCVMDTHTAVAASVYNDYSLDLDDEAAALIMSPVSPYVSAKEVLASLGTKERDSIKAVGKLQAATALDCPDDLYDIERAEDNEKTATAARVSELIAEFMANIQK